MKVPVSWLKEYVDFEDSIKYGIILMKTIGPKMMYIDNCTFKNYKGINDMTKKL